MTVLPAHPDPQVLDWWRTGEKCFAVALSAVRDSELERRSLLPGWTRRTVVAHVSRNADALVNLLTWARTGVETPMYADDRAREQDIIESARRSAPALRDDNAAAAGRFGDSVASLPGPAWGALVRTAQGRVVPAAEIIWMRTREVWLHALDLASGTISPPDELLCALIDDVLQTWARRCEALDLRLEPTDSAARWGIGGATVGATATLAELAWWITGRQESASIHLSHLTPELPRWL